ncbi:hypothetical protein Ciccas_009129 [Cichlidogyrus casuarinus]|uniref:Iron hydrogenase large subunit C-terminal domain-containing protein n=1 Tax=Cichlidogyrus casuarinus TaxID=1844966 RepID=A0ABD2PXX2_9PLAT
MLVAQHSSSQLLQMIVDAKRCTSSHQIVFVISPQSIASFSAAVLDQENYAAMAVKFASWLGPEKCDNLYHMQVRVKSFIKQLLTRAVKPLELMLIDSSIGRDIALQESCLEFDQRIQDYPLLCGICPGFVCYAEKSYEGDLEADKNSFSLLRHLSRVRSPQQIVASLVKTQLKSPYTLISVMPCFDKKLEASRAQFCDPKPEVDLVLGTNEFLQYLQDVPLEDAIGEVDDLSSKLNLGSEMNWWSECYRHGGTRSGGYLHSVFCHASAKMGLAIAGDEVASDEKVLVRNLANKDIQEFILFQDKQTRDDAEKFLSETVTRSFYRNLCRQKPALPKACLVFLLATGFRNIQNMVTEMKRSWKKRQSCLDQDDPLFDYAEVMACPSGCINGGAQLKSTNSNLVNNVYDSSRRIMESKVNYNRDDQSAFTTDYKHVPKIEIIRSSSLAW